MFLVLPRVQSKDIFEPAAARQIDASQSRLPTFFVDQYKTHIRSSLQNQMLGQSEFIYNYKKTNVKYLSTFFLSKRQRESQRDSNNVDKTIQSHFLSVFDRQRLNFSCFPEKRDVCVEVSYVFLCVCHASYRCYSREVIMDFIRNYSHYFYFRHNHD